MDQKEIAAYAKLMNLQLGLEESSKNAKIPEP